MRGGTDGQRVVATRMSRLVELPYGYFRLSLVRESPFRHDDIVATIDYRKPSR